jgi:hypothetical protein
MKPSIKILPLLACLFLGCSYVKPMPKSTKASLGAKDTIYVMPSRATFLVKGFVFNKSDSAKSERIRLSADAILWDELARAFPAATLKKLDPGADSARTPGGSPVVSCSVKAFRRTLPREIVSETLNVIFMIPTFAFNMGYPIQTTSSVYIKIDNNGSRRIVSLKHRDMLDANDEGDLHFQIRKILEPGWKG